MALIVLARIANPLIHDGEGMKLICEKANVCLRASCPHIIPHKPDKRIINNCGDRKARIHCMGGLCEVKCIPYKAPKESLKQVREERDAYRWALKKLLASIREQQEELGYMAEDIESLIDIKAKDLPMVKSLRTLAKDTQKYIEKVKKGLGK